MASFGYQVLGFGSGGGGQAPYTVRYLVIGGGGAGPSVGGGGGAGGYRTISCKTFEVCGASPITVTVGAGGGTGQRGNDSVFSTITSTSGGRGSTSQGTPPCTSQGGSGGGDIAAQPPLPAPARPELAGRRRALRS